VAIAGVGGIDATVNRVIGGTPPATQPVPVSTAPLPGEGAGTPPATLPPGAPDMPKLGSAQTP
jgi:hypothetical protein